LRVAGEGVDAQGKVDEFKKKVAFDAKTE